MRLVETSSSLEPAALPLPSGGFCAERSCDRARAACLASTRCAARRHRHDRRERACDFEGSLRLFSRTIHFCRIRPGRDSPLADFVFFPAFIFMAGFSLAASLPPCAARLAGAARIGAANGRADGARLSADQYRLVRQYGSRRLAACLVCCSASASAIFATAILFVTCGLRCARLRLAFASFFLVYWPLTLIPIPGHATSLLLPRSNSPLRRSQWSCGSHALVTGRADTIPKLLSTLPRNRPMPARALAGNWLLNNRAVERAPWKLARGGAVTLAVGLAWSPLFPLVQEHLVQQLCSLCSTGLVMLPFAIFLVGTPTANG